MTIRRIAIVVLLLLFATFVVMNRATAHVWFFGIKAEMPLAFVVLVAGGLGAAAGLLGAMVQSRRPAAKDKPQVPPS
jgi:uncharacterized integral membrane protein